MKTVLLLCCLLLPQLAWAVECVTIPTAGWPELRIAVRAAQGYRILALATGENILPTITGDTLCFQGALADIPAVVTAAAMQSEWNTQSAAWATAQAAQDALVASYQTEMTNNLCTASLAELDQRIDALLDPATTVAQLRTATKTALKRLARCLRAYRGVRP